MVDLEKDVPEKNDNKWELSDIPDLLNEIIHLCHRLGQEQDNARELLSSCRRSWYLKEPYLTKERRRLNSNITNIDEREKFWREALVDFSKEQINESKPTKPI